MIYLHYRKELTRARLIPCPVYHNRHITANNYLHNSLPMINWRGDNLLEKIKLEVNQMKKILVELEQNIEQITKGERFVMSEIIAQINELPFNN